MSRAPRIAFVILTWNSERHVEPCVRSVLACSGIDASVAVVDNGATDETPAMLRALAAAHGEVHPVFLDENLGTTVSRNIALRNLPEGAEYVCVLDSDTVVNGKALLRMVDLLDGDPSIGVVGPAMRDSAGVVQQSGRNLPTLGIKLMKALPGSKAQARGARLEAPSSPVVGRIQDVPYLISACWLVPVRVFRQVGLLDERIFYAPEDVDWCLRCRKAGYRVVWCHDAEIVHEYQRISKKRFFSKTNLEHLKGLAHYFRKHRYLLDAGKALETEKRP